MFTRKKSYTPDFKKEKQFLDNLFGPFLSKIFKNNGAFVAGGCIKFFYIL